MLCQPGDGGTIRETHGFGDVTEVAPAATHAGVELRRTGGRHGHGELAERMGQVSGFVLRAAGEPSVYVAGDTVWCEEVEAALDEHRPDVVVVNAGAATFTGEPPITMDADDVRARRGGCAGGARRRRPPRGVQPLRPLPREPEGGDRGPPDRRARRRRGDRPALMQAWPGPSDLRVGLGCMRLPADDEERAAATIAAAADAGVTVFDTARAYGDNEPLLARALRGRAARIVTKGGMARPDGAWVPDGRAKALGPTARRASPRSTAARSTCTSCTRPIPERRGGRRSARSRGSRTRAS